MARGGSRGRRTSYVRDNSGRFASTPGGGPPKRSTPASRRAARRAAAKPTVTGGTLGARGSLRRSRAKLATKNPADRSLRGSLGLRAQRGAVTRGANRLGKARAASTVRMAARAGVIRGGRKVAAKPVVAPRSSVRVIRPNRPAMRPGPGPDRGKISEYVGAVRGARRRLSSAKPGSANAAEAKQGLKDNRRALSRRIQRERGARRGLKPATSQQVLTGTVPAPPARRAKAARPSGTLAKPRGLKPGAIAAKKAKAAASGARAARATTNYNRAQKAALEAQQRLNRRRSPKNQAAADKAQKTLRTAARAYRILVGLGGEKMAVARKPSPKGAGPRMKASRVAGTVAKVQSKASKKAALEKIIYNGSNSLEVRKAARDKIFKLDPSYSLEPGRQKFPPKQLSAAEKAANVTTAASEQRRKEFTASMPPMQRAKANAALEKYTVNNGNGVLRQALIEDRVSKGFRVQTQNGKRRLVGPGGAYFEQSALTKTGLDYAAFLARSAATPRRRNP